MVAVLERRDLVHHAQGLPLNEITSDHIAITLQIRQQSKLVILFDKPGGDYVILKSNLQPSQQSPIFTSEHTFFALVRDHLK